jgi:hypothetical protein
MAKSYFEQLKEGIENEDWNKVRKVYEGLTGEKLGVSKQREYSRENTDDCTIGTNASFGSRSASSGSEKKGKVQLIKKNLFRDTGVEAAKDKLTTAEKKKFKRTDLGREPAKTVKVSCVECNEPAFVLESTLKTSLDDTGMKFNKKEYVCGDCLSKRSR